MSDTDQELSSLDTIFDLLSNPRRRFVLHYLERVNEPVELTELAARIAAEENDVPIDELTSQQRKRAYVSLYQSHVPKLEQAGVVTYDPDTGEVELTDQARVIDEQLDTADDTPPWEWIYLAVAVAGLGVVLASPVAGIGRSTQIQLGILVLALVLVTAVVNYVYARQRDGDGLALVDREED